MGETIMRIFYVLYIPPNELADCIDAIRFLANPQIKRRAHVTVRGPYERPISLDKLNRALAGNEMTVTGVGRFIGAQQQTVFLACDGTRLRQAWWKRDYGYCPHITLYDGHDAALADAIARAAEPHQYAISFASDRLEPLVSGPGQAHAAMGERFDHSLSDLVRVVTSETLSAAEVAGLGRRRRLRLVEAMLEHLAGLSAASRPGQPVPRTDLQVAAQVAHLYQA